MQDVRETKKDEARRRLGFFWRRDERDDDHDHDHDDGESSWKKRWKETLF